MMSVDEVRVRSRTSSESSDLGLGGMCEVGSLQRGVSYDMDGKFSYSQVLISDTGVHHHHCCVPGGQVRPHQTIQDHCG